MEEQKKIKLLWASDTRTMATGYGTVTHNVLKGLQETNKYDLFSLGFQYFGQPINLSGVPILPNGNKPYGEDILQGHLSNVRPEILVTLCDMFRTPWFKKLNLKETGTKWVAYFPLDAEELPLGSEEAFKHADYKVAMAAFTKQEAEKNGIKVDAMIPHGVDLDLYRKIDRKEIIEKSGLLLYKFDNEGKKQFIEIKNAGFENKYIIGSVFRNCGRKKPERLLEAFARYSKSNPEAILWLHTDPKDVQAFNLFEYAKRRGVLDKMYFTAIHSVAYAAALPMMPYIYSMFDIHALSTTGEGFGLPVIESLACGVPNVMTDYTTAKELIGDDRGIRVPVIGYIYGQHLTKRALVDIDKLKETFKKLENKELREKYSKNALEFVKDYDWKIINKKWDDFFKSIANGTI